MEFDPVSNKIIGCALEVHRILGPGLLESVYEQALAYELIQAGLRVQTQVALPVTYKAVNLDCGFRLDLLTAPTARRPAPDLPQALGREIGLLLNFNVPPLKHGIKRLVN